MVNIDAKSLVKPSNSIETALRIEPTNMYGLRRPNRDLQLSAITPVNVICQLRRVSISKAATHRQEVVQLILIVVPLVIQLTSRTWIDRALQGKEVLERSQCHAFNNAILLGPTKPTDEINRNGVPSISARERLGKKW